MHNAPSVTYPVGRSRFALGLVLAAWIAGLLACLLWWWQVQPAQWRGALAGALVAASGMWGLRVWSHSELGALSWDGQDWSWSGTAVTEEGSPQTSLDMQRWMLVRWSGRGASRWLWLDRSAAPARWDDLRRAVYSRARPDAVPGV